MRLQRRRRVEKKKEMAMAIMKVATTATLMNEYV